jgi:hypothetical protein
MASADKFVGQKVVRNFQTPTYLQKKTVILITTHFCASNLQQHNDGLLLAGGKGVCSEVRFIVASRTSTPQLWFCSDLFCADQVTTNKMVIVRSLLPTLPLPWSIFLATQK